MTDPAAGALRPGVQTLLPGSNGGAIRLDGPDAVTATHPAGTLPGAVAASPQASLGELVATVSKDLSLLVRGEIDLAKAEITGAAKSAGVGIGLAVAAGVLGAVAALCALVAAADGLANLIPHWAAWLVVVAALLLVAGLLGFVAARRLKTVKGPERTKRTVSDDLAWLKHPRVAPGSRTR